MRIFILRHAESYSNVQGKILSTTDLPLTEKGIKQAEVTKKFLHEIIGAETIEYAFCSRLLRARQTADIIIKEQCDIIESDYLKEMNVGELEGLTWVERAKKYPYIDIEKSLSCVNMPNGENYHDVETRCKIFIKEYIIPVMTNSNILIVTHGITKRVLVNSLLNKPNEYVNYLNWCDNCSFSEIEFDIVRGVCKLVRLNERQHLCENGLGTDNFQEWAYFADTNYAIV